MSKYEKKILSRLVGKKSVKRHAPVRYKELINELKSTERERLDFLHIIELKDLTDEQYIDISKKLREVLQRRREIKNELEYYKRLVELVEEKVQINRRLVRKVLEEVTKSFENRVYYIRERNDLTDYIGGDIQCSRKKSK